jgi:hypothetical protein
MPTRRPTFRNYDKMPANRNGIEYFYRNLIAWGVSLSVQDGRIVIHAPAGNVAPALEKAIRQREQQLLAHLWTLA